MADSLTMFGPYRVIKTLARGGMAEIFIAKKEGPAGFSKTVVVKRIVPEHATNAEFVHMFRDEARLAAQLEHPNIVHITDFGEVQGTYYLAMEYLQGQDLGSLLRSRINGGQGPIPVLVAASIAAQACAGLHYAHTFADETGKPLRIVHRDISPSNLFVTYQGAVKVLDFGIAKAEGKLTQTRAGMVKGKLLYMSPEQTWAKALDARSDVWALGVVLYELLTATRPFFRAGEDDVHVMNERLTMMAIDQEEPRPLEVLVPSIPPSLGDIVMKCLAKEPSKRWQTAAELRRALEAFLQSQHASGSLLVDFMEQTVGSEQIRQLTQPTPVRAQERVAAPTRVAPEDISVIEPLSAIDRSLQTRAAPPPEDPELFIGTEQRLGNSVASEPTRVRPPRRAPEASSGLKLLVVVALAGLALAAALFATADERRQPELTRPAGASSGPVRAQPRVEDPVDAGAKREAVFESAPVVDAGLVALSSVVVDAGRPTEFSKALTPPATTKVRVAPVTPGPSTPPSLVVRPESSDLGSLKVSCAPYGVVSIDGKEIGTASPTLVTELSAGTHSVSCKHPELGQPRTTVTITAGATTEKRLDY